MNKQFDKKSFKNCRILYQDQNLNVLKKALKYKLITLIKRNKSQLMQHCVSTKFLNSLPSQVVPFPRNPGLQEQEKLPGTLVQIAASLPAQLSVSSVHSSISEAKSASWQLLNHVFTYNCYARARSFFVFTSILFAFVNVLAQIKAKCNQ